jgi:hypothetical protein
MEMLGRSVQKDFGPELGAFFGEVVGVHEREGVGLVAMIRYEDGDEEEVTEEELQNIVLPEDTKVAPASGLEVGDERSSSSLVHAFVGQQVSKDFGPELGAFGGEVVRVHEREGVGLVAMIRYEDGDEEEITEEELQAILV